MRLCIHLISYDQQMHLTQMMIADVLPLFLPVCSLCHVLPIFNLVAGIVHLITCFCFWSIYVSGSLFLFIIYSLV